MQPYIVLAGGLIVNEPTIPVLNMDLMDIDIEPDEDMIEAVRDLYEATQKLVIQRPDDEQLIYIADECNRWLGPH